MNQQENKNEIDFHTCYFCKHSVHSKQKIRCVDCNIIYHKHCWLGYDDGIKEDHFLFCPNCENKQEDLKIVCECGGKYYKHNFKKHNITDQHMDYILKDLK